jgi:hypothetical protein
MCVEGLGAQVFGKITLRRPVCHRTCPDNLTLGDLGASIQLVPEYWAPSRDLPLARAPGWTRRRQGPTCSGDTTHRLPTYPKRSDM